MDKYLKQFYDAVCDVTEDLGTCANPAGHLHRATPNVRDQLNAICAKRGQDLSPDQIKEVFTTIENVWVDIVDCDAPPEEFGVRGNVFVELDDIRRRARTYSMFHKDTAVTEWDDPTTYEPAEAPERAPAKLAIKELDLVKDRERRIKERRDAGDPIALEEATGYDCGNVNSPVSVLEHYFCGNTTGLYGVVSSPESFHYEGELKFDLQTNAKDHKRIHKIRQEFLEGVTEGDNRDQLIQFLGCVGDQLDGGEMFQQCGDSFISECTSADEIRKALTPYGIAKRSKKKIREDKEWIQRLERQLVEPPREESPPSPWESGIKWRGGVSPEREERTFAEKRQELTERIARRKQLIRRAESLLKDKRLREAEWRRSKARSLDRGYFFTRLSIGSGAGNRGNISVGGTVISPIHDLLSEELSQIRQFVSEALYACTPPEHRLGKRKLDFFKV